MNPFPEFLVNFIQTNCLKKLLTIGLIVLYLFNLSGYFLFFKYLIYQSDQQFIDQLNNDQYNESLMMEVKIPLNLPYVTSQSDYERVDGELEYKGVYYNYVKRKVSNDTLYLMCLPNNKKTNLYTAATEYAKKVNDFPNNPKEGNSATKKISLTTEYTQLITSFEIPVTTSLQTKYNSKLNTDLVSSFICDFFQPPRLLS